MFFPSTKVSSKLQSFTSGSSLYRSFKNLWRSSIFQESVLQKYFGKKSLFCCLKSAKLSSLSKNTIEKFFPSSHRPPLTAIFSLLIAQVPTPLMPTLTRHAGGQIKRMKKFINEMVYVLIMTENVVYTMPLIAEQTNVCKFCRQGLSAKRVQIIIIILTSKLMFASSTNIKYQPFRWSSRRCRFLHACVPTKSNELLIFLTSSGKKKFKVGEFDFFVVSMTSTACSS